ncbi:Protein of unknown function [Rhizobiales bacterium GAS113]|nr:Protein of unknown function [Rhizobiales bacterium GAS113]
MASSNVTAPITLMPNARKAKDNELVPDSRKNGFELGARWNRASRNTGEEYISISLSAPEFGTIHGKVAPSSRICLLESSCPSTFCIAGRFAEWWAETVCYDCTRAGTRT